MFATLPCLWRPVYEAVQFNTSCPEGLFGAGVGRAGCPTLLLSSPLLLCCLLSCPLCFPLLVLIPYLLGSCNTDAGGLAPWHLAMPALLRACSSQQDARVPCLILPLGSPTSHRFYCHRFPTQPFVDIHEPAPMTSPSGGVRIAMVRLWSKETFTLSYTAVCFSLSMAKQVGKRCQ